MPFQACFCIYMCRPVSVCLWRFGLEDDRRCKVYRWWMQTKFYWISFLVQGFGQRSRLFPSAEREECHTNSRTEEEESETEYIMDPVFQRSIHLALSPRSVLDSIFPHVHPSSRISLISFPSSTRPQSPLSLHVFTPTLYFFLSFFFICNYSNM